MKLIHLSDLHLGKRLKEVSMTEDQDYILKEILQIIDREEPDAVMIAGDVYDRSVPSEEAIGLWDSFLVSLAGRSFHGRRLEVFVSSGNHDSAVRLAEHHELIGAAGIHICPAYDGHVGAITLMDEFGPVHFYMLPFIKPAMVRPFFPDAEINDYTDACRVAIEEMQVDRTERSILLAHQFVTGADQCDSEEKSVGGLDQVSVEVFDAFDYVALGHIHGPQSVGRETVRYCGTPLKYSLSEKDHRKSVTVVELGAKGDVNISTADLTPLHDVRELQGKYDRLMAHDFYAGTAVDDYIWVVLTDDDEVPMAMNKLRVVYPNVMEVRSVNRRTSLNQEITAVADVKSKTPMELVAELYEKQNNQPMSEEQREFMDRKIREVWGI